MNKLKSLLWVAIIAAFSFSCSDDEDVIDVRAEAVGSYSYDLTAYVLDGTTLQEFANSDGTFSVATDPANESGLIITEGSTKFTINKVTAASNGFTFDVPAQSVTDDGTKINISGYNGAQLVSSGGSTTLYNGVYISTTKKLTFYFKYTDPDLGATIVFEFDGTKK